MGFTFTPTAVPSQLVSQGTVPQVLGVCFTPPPVDNICTKTSNNTFNDFIFMGPAPLPSDLPASALLVRLG
jgi:hypothetical protein